MSNELSDTRVLVCPQDRSKHPAPSFARLRPENVSYLLRTGTNVSEEHPNEIVVVCPIHGSRVLCDGSVIEGKREPEPWWRQPWWRPYQDLIKYDERARLLLYCGLCTLSASVLLVLLRGALKFIVRFRRVNRSAV